MKRPPVSILVVLLMLIGLSAVANDSAYVKFIFTAPLTPRKFYIEVNNGIDVYKINPQSKQYWSGELFSPYGHILIGYCDSNTTVVTKQLFFKKGSSTIYLDLSLNVVEYFCIGKKSSDNIIPYGEMGGDALDLFLKEKNEICGDFLRKNVRKIGSDFAVTREASALSDSVTYKKIEFIRQYPDLYVSFWTFLSSIVKTGMLSPDSLMVYYNTFLPAKYKRNKAAEKLLATIQNKINVATNGHFPDFSVTDISNKRIESAKLRGKYVLIQIWASWCSPCVQELPDLKLINDRYKDSDFILISFSTDTDSIAFRKAVEKHSMNWTQIFGDNRLYNSLANVPIPQLYLLDKAGRTIYNGDTMHDTDLTVLKRILSEQLGK